MNVLKMKYLKQMDKFIHYCNNYTKQKQVNVY